MKKWIIIVAAAGVLGGGGWWGWATFFKPKVDAPALTTAKAERGQIRLVVASTGRVVSNLDVDIKCKASGTITKLPYEKSNFVAKGAILMELDPVDEQRNVDLAQVSLDCSNAKLKTAQHNLKVAELTLATDTARANSALKAADAHAKDTSAKADRLKALKDSNLASQEEYETAQTAAVQAASDLEGANIKIQELNTQKEALEVSRQQMVLAEKQVKSDQIALDIASQRLADTKVISPMDSVVTALNVQVGNIVSSGISTVGGGTTVMTLSDLSKLFVLASVDESEIGKLQDDSNEAPATNGEKSKFKEDLPVNLTFDAFKGRKFFGKVVRIAPRGDNVSNVITYEVKIEVLNKPLAALQRAASGPAGEGKRGGKRRGTAESGPAAASSPAGDGNMIEVRMSTSAPAAPPAMVGTPVSDLAAQLTSRPTTQPGGKAASAPKSLMQEMTANVEIVADNKDDVLLVPADAVVRKSGKVYCVTVVKDGGNEERTVVIGVSDGQKTEIVSGLSEGETVVVYKGQSNRFTGGQGQFNPQRVLRGR